MTEQKPQTTEDLSLDDFQDNEERKSSTSSSKTILPSPIASIISLATSISSFGLRAGGYIGSAAINGARIGTLTSFELGRVIIEGILIRAGNETVQSSLGEQGRLAAEGVLERALSTLHYSITHTSFLISAGFQIGSTSLASSLAISQYTLSALDAVFGDTETSKAVATIISLVRREFKNPETGVGHEKVGLGDLLLGICSFALLQRWEFSRTEQELKDARVVEVVWDMVVIKDGIGQYPSTSATHDVTRLEHDSFDPLPGENCSASFVSAKGHLEPFDAIQDQQSLNSLNSSMWRTSSATNEAFKHQMASQLKPGSSIRLIAESKVTDRVEIEVKGDPEADIQPPPGFTLLAVDRQSQWNGTSTFIFQRSQRKRRRGSFIVDDSIANVEDMPDYSNTDDPSSQGLVDSNVDDYPPSDVPEIEPWNEKDSTVNELDISDASEFTLDQKEQSFQPLEQPHVGGIAANQKRQRRPKQSQPGSCNNSLASSTASSLDSQGLSNNAHSNISSTKTYVENSPLRKAMSKSKSVKNLVEFWSRERQRQHQGGSAVSNHKSNFSLDATADTTSSTLSAQFSSLRVPERSSSINSSSNPQHMEFSWDGRRPDSRPTTANSHHRHRSSIYSVASVASETSLMLRPLQFDDYLDDYVASLHRSAFAPGQYPRGNFASNLSRFARFSLASYGSKFLRLTGALTGATPAFTDHKHLPQHHSFSHYTNLPASTVLLSSYVDPNSGFRLGNDKDSGLPLVFYVTIDHESKAVILTCRGTLGFEDILTDMTAEYTSITWRSRTFQVHKGVYASAKRLLQSDNQRILTTLQLALEEWDDYGLILCGHSLGGAVAAMLAILLSQKNTTSAGGAARFVTCSYSPYVGSLRLPTNRPIHAYAYGPAACVSPSLQRASRGLVTTVVHRDDIVPFLSLGTLRDLQAVAWAFKVDTNDAKGEVRRRALASLAGASRKGSSETSFPRPMKSSSDGKERSGWFGLSSWWSSGSKNLEGEEEEDHWGWSALKSLRASLLADKLVPPGDVFIMEATPVLQRDAFVTSSSLEPTDSHTKTSSGQSSSPKKRKTNNTNARNIEELKPDNQDQDNHFSGNTQPNPTMRSYKPATRLTINLVRDVERRFSEVRFSPGMFTDHFPVRYLEVLEDLNRAIGS